jgi:hypothetical protein
MSDQSGASEAAKDIGGPLGPIFGLGLRLLPEGPLQTLLYVVIVLCVVLWPFVNKYYLGLLAQGSKPEGSIERQDYDRLRASLAGGNLATRLYAKWLTAFLDGVERFFGDAGKADRTLFPRIFGLKKPAPLWTAPAFDRCLLLALIYPIATIFLIWAISGQVGPAEAALGLKPDIPPWSRGIAAAAYGFSNFALWRSARSARTQGWKSFIWLAAAIGAFVAGVRALPFGIFDSAATIVFFAFAFPFASAGIVPGAVIIAGAGASTVVLAVAGPGAIAIAVGGAAAVFALSALANRKLLQGVFLSLFLPAMVLTYFAAAAFMLYPPDTGPHFLWSMPFHVAGPLLLFLGLLTLFNAPFDWASLGLTRALLRRGLELGGWWPYLLALADACLAGVIIALLALTMVVGVQAFDELAVHGGGEKAAVLPLPALFDGIETNPAAPEYWWVYALLLSTMIPSIINLTIGGMAFTRGVPGVSRLLLRWIPEGREVPDYRRPLAALVLTGQMFAGAFLGIAAQALLAWGLIFHVMPAIGPNLLDMARAVTAFNLPARVSQLFMGLR